MGETGTERFSNEDKAQLASLREDMELARLAFIEAKEEFERACDAVYLFVRARRESE